MAAPRFLRDASRTLMSQLGASECIPALIRYIQEKFNVNPSEWSIGNRVVTIKNVYPALIELLNKKGFLNLSNERVLSLDTKIRAGQTDRVTIFNELKTWVTPKIDVAEKGLGKILRYAWTQESTDQLAQHVKASVERLGGVFCRDWNHCENDAIPCDAYEREHIIDLALRRIDNGGDFEPGKKESGQTDLKKVKEIYNQSKKEHKTFHILKKECGICWLCSNPIHLYAVYYDGIEPEVLHNNCGQQEHLSTPGFGNFLGLLFGEMKGQKNAIQRSDIALHGFKPSHAFCNQSKGDIDFIRIVKNESTNNYTYELWYGDEHSEGINSFKEELRRWLTIKAINKSGKRVYQIEYSFELIFKKKNMNNPAIEKFIDHAIGGLEVQLREICRIANETAASNAASEYEYRNAQVLCRLAFYGSIMFHDALLNITDYKDLFKSYFGVEWVKYGGNHKKRLQKKMSGGKYDLATLPYVVYEETTCPNYYQIDAIKPENLHLDIAHLKFGARASQASLASMAPKPAGQQKDERVFGQNSEPIKQYLVQTWQVPPELAETIIIGFELKAPDIYIFESLKGKIPTPVQPQTLISFFLSKKYNMKPQLVHKYISSIEIMKNGHAKIKELLTQKQEGKLSAENRALNADPETILHYFVRINVPEDKAKELIREFEYTDEFVPVFEEISRQIDNINIHRLMAAQLSIAAQRSGIVINPELIYKHLTTSDTIPEAHRKIVRMVQLKREGKQNNEINAILAPKETILHYFIRMGASEVEAKEVIKGFRYTDESVPIFEEISRRIDNINIYKLIAAQLSIQIRINPELIYKYLISTDRVHENIRKIKRMFQLKQQHKTNNEINALLNKKETILQYFLRMGLSEVDAKVFIEVFKYTDESVPVFEEISRRIDSINIHKILADDLSTGAEHTAHIRINPELIYKYLITSDTVHEKLRKFKRMLELKHQGKQNNEINAILESLSILKHLMKYDVSKEQAEAFIEAFELNDDDVRMLPIDPVKTRYENLVSNLTFFVGDKYNIKQKDKRWLTLRYTISECNVDKMKKIIELIKLGKSNSNIRSLLNTGVSLSLFKIVPSILDRYFLEHTSDDKDIVEYVLSKLYKEYKNEETAIQRISEILTVLQTADHKLNHIKSKHSTLDFSPSLVHYLKYIYDKKLIPYLNQLNNIIDVIDQNVNLFIKVRKPNIPTYIVDFLYINETIKNHELTLYIVWYFRYIHISGKLGYEETIGDEDKVNIISRFNKDISEGLNINKQIVLYNCLCRSSYWYKYVTNLRYVMSRVSNIENAKILLQFKTEQPAYALSLILSKDIIESDVNFRSIYPSPPFIEEYGQVVEKPSMLPTHTEIRNGFSTDNINRQHIDNYIDTIWIPNFKRELNYIYNEVPCGGSWYSQKFQGLTIRSYANQIQFPINTYQDLLQAKAMLLRECEQDPTYKAKMAEQKRYEEEQARIKAAEVERERQRDIRRRELHAQQVATATAQAKVEAAEGRRQENQARASRQAWAEFVGQKLGFHPSTVLAWTEQEKEKWLAILQAGFGVQGQMAAAKETQDADIAAFRGHWEPLGSTIQRVIESPHLPNTPEGRHARAVAVASRNTIDHRTNVLSSVHASNALKHGVSFGNTASGAPAPLPYPATYAQVAFPTPHGQSMPSAPLSNRNQGKRLFNLQKLNPNGSAWTQATGPIGSQVVSHFGQHPAASAPVASSFAAQQHLFGSQPGAISSFAQAPQGPPVQSALSVPHTATFADQRKWAEEFAQAQRLDQRPAQAPSSFFGRGRKTRRYYQKNHKWQTRSKHSRPQKNRKWQTRSKRPQKKSKKNRLNRK